MQAIGDIQLRKDLQVIQDLLIYHYSINPRSNLDQTVSKTFWEKLYVTRYTDQRLQDSIDTSRMTILQGLAGTGKTSLLLNLTGQLKEKFKKDGVERDVLYVNLHQKTNSEIKELEKSYSGSSICFLVYDALYKYYHGIKPNTPPKRNTDIFYAYQLRYSEVYKEFFEVISNLENKNLMTCSDEELLEIVREGNYNQYYPSKPFLKSMITQRLIDLLIFIKLQAEKKNKDEICLPVLIIDNIDRLMVGIQRRVIDKCINPIGLHAKIYLAIRDNNYRNIELSDGAMGYDHDCVELAKEKQSDKFINDFITNRIDLARSENAIKVDAYVLDVVDKLNKQLQATPKKDNENFSSIVSRIGGWRNHSVRYIAGDIAFLLGCSINKINGCSPKLFEQTGFKNYRKLRTAVYRQMITGHREAYAHQSSGTPNIYQFDEESAYCPFPYFTLLYLCNKNRNFESGVTLGFVAEKMQALGLKKERVISLVNELAGYLGPSRNQEDNEMFGFLYVHNSSKRLSNESRDSTVIEIQPRGSFLLRWLATSSEYLYWMEGEHKEEKRSGSIRETKIIVSSIDFFCEVVARELLLSEKKVNASETHPSIKRAYRDIYDGGVYKYLERVRASLDSFAGQVADDSNKNSEPFRIIEAAKKQLSSLKM